MHQTHSGTRKIERRRRIKKGGGGVINSIQTFRRNRIRSHYEKYRLDFVNFLRKSKLDYMAGVQKSREDYMKFDDETKPTLGQLIEYSNHHYHRNGYRGRTQKVGGVAVVLDDIDFEQLRETNSQPNGVEHLQETNSQPNRVEHQLRSSRPSVHKFKTYSKVSPDNPVSAKRVMIGNIMFRNNNYMLIIETNGHNIPIIRTYISILHINLFVDTDVRQELDGCSYKNTNTQFCITVKDKSDYSTVVSMFFDSQAQMDTVVGEFQKHSGDGNYYKIHAHPSSPKLTSAPALKSSSVKTRKSGITINSTPENATLPPPHIPPPRIPPPPPPLTTNTPAPSFKFTTYWYNATPKTYANNSSIGHITFHDFNPDKYYNIHYEFGQQRKWQFLYSTITSIDLFIDPALQTHLNTIHADYDHDITQFWLTVWANDFIKPVVCMCLQSEEARRAIVAEFQKKRNDVPINPTRPQPPPPPPPQPSSSSSSAAPSSSASSSAPLPPPPLSSLSLSASAPPLSSASLSEPSSSSSAASSSNPSEPSGLTIETLRSNTDAFYNPNNIVLTQLKNTLHYANMENSILHKSNIDAELGEKIVQFASTTRPFVHSNVRSLIDEFLNLTTAKYHTTKPEISGMYENMNAEQFIIRCLVKRPLVFFRADDYYVLQDGKNGNGNIDDPLHYIVDDNNRPVEARLSEYINYDEMQISALISMSTPTLFINSGARNNKGKRETDANKLFEQSGVYVGSVGARFERPGVMEYAHMLVTEAQNKPENGYGPNPNDTNGERRSILQVWARFYNINYFPIYDIAALDSDTSRYVKIPRTYETNHKQYYFDVQIYKKRMRMVVEAFLLEANDRALIKRDEPTSEITSAYVRATGLGLGVWAVTPQFKINQNKLLVEVYADVLDTIRLPFISDLEFVYFEANTCNDIAGGQLYAPVNRTSHLNNHITIHFSRDDPAKNLNAPSKLLVAQYAWDSNSYPGNEYWLKMFEASGDPAAACCSLISELQNPQINTSAFVPEKIKFWGADAESTSGETPFSKKGSMGVGVGGGAVGVGGGGAVGVGGGGAVGVGGGVGGGAAVRAPTPPDKLLLFQYMSGSKKFKPAPFTSANNMHITCSKIRDAGAESINEISVDNTSYKYRIYKSTVNDILFYQTFAIESRTPSYVDYLIFAEDEAAAQQKYNLYHDPPGKNEIPKQPTLQALIEFSEEKQEYSIVKDLEYAIASGTFRISYEDIEKEISKNITTREDFKQIRRLNHLLKNIGEIQIKSTTILPDHAGYNIEYTYNGESLNPPRNVCFDSFFMQSGNMTYIDQKQLLPSNNLQSGYNKLLLGN